jgi:uncharacterized protein (DUF2252 family)
MTPTAITASTRAYEKWLRTQLGKQIVENDLRKKHKKMAEGPFPFLRATYWRWAETILDLCPELARAPAVLAVGDIHLENFGTWSDADGRLVWGVNDFDEAAEMPYPLDLVRLATSAVLGGPGSATTDDICTELLKGYALGLANPRAIVLDRDFAWLRQLVVVTDKERADFWRKMETLAAGGKPPMNYTKALAAAMPERGIDMIIRRRTAGAGSLGRPRWVGIGQWHGAPIVREAKAMVPSAWTRAHGRGRTALQYHRIATGRYRSPDPWLALTGDIATRRLSPNNRKIEAAERPFILTSGQMLRSMGRDLAAIHLGIAARRKAIEHDLGNRKRNWLRSAVERAADFVRRDCSAWRKA